MIIFILFFFKIHGQRFAIKSAVASAFMRYEFDWYIDGSRLGL